MKCINLYNLIFENHSVALPTFNRAPGRREKWFRVDSKRYASKMDVHESAGEALWLHRTGTVVGIGIHRIRLFPQAPLRRRTERGRNHTPGAVGRAWQRRGGHKMRTVSAILWDCATRSVLGFH